MKYEEFKSTMGRKLAEIVAPIGHMEVQETTLRKVNCNADAIAIIEGDGKEKCGPTLRYDEMYGYYVNVANGNFSKTLEYFLVQIMMAFQNVDRIGKEALTAEEKWDDLRLTMQVINADRNEELLETIPYRMIEGLDLAVIYRIIISIDEDGGFNSAIITHDIANMLHKTEDELHEKAKVTMEELLPCEIRSYDEQFCIVTNKGKTLGAIYGFDLNKLKDIAEILGGDLYIIPSSLHECFIIPAISNDVDGLKQCITEANNMVISDEEFLSNNPYLYLKKENAIVMA